MKGFLTFFGTNLGNETNYCELRIQYFLFIDLMELKMMMEKLGQAKTHLELKKMIKGYSSVKIMKTSSKNINLLDKKIL